MIKFFLIPFILATSLLSSLQIQEKLKHHILKYEIALPEDSWTTLYVNHLLEDDIELCLWSKELKYKLLILYTSIEKDKTLDYSSASSYLFSLLAHPEYKSSLEIMKKIYTESKKNHSYLTFKLLDVKDENDIIFEKKSHALGPFSKGDELIRIIKQDDKFLLIRISKEEHFSKEEKEKLLFLLRDSIFTLASK